MIFKSRTTKALSNVTEQKAWRRSFSLWSSMSLMRTSVITTAFLLYSVATSEATAHYVDAPQLRLPGFRPKSLDDIQCLGLISTQCKAACSAAAHQTSGWPGLEQALPEAQQFRPQSVGGLLKPVVKQTAQGGR